MNHDGKIRTDAADRFGPDILTEYVIDKMRSAPQKGQPFLIHHNMPLPHAPIAQTPLDKKKKWKASLANMIEYLYIQVGNDQGGKSE